VGITAHSFNPVSHVELCDTGLNECAVMPTTLHVTLDWMSVLLCPQLYMWHWIEWVCCYAHNSTCDTGLNECSVMPTTLHVTLDWLSVLLCPQLYMWYWIEWVVCYAHNSTCDTGLNECGHNRTLIQSSVTCRVVGTTEHSFNPVSHVEMWA
jgi:hypothetical protein